MSPPASRAAPSQSCARVCSTGRSSTRQVFAARSSHFRRVGGPAAEEEGLAHGGLHHRGREERGERLVGGERGERLARLVGGVDGGGVAVDPDVALEVAAHLALPAAHPLGALRGEVGAGDLAGAERGREQGGGRVGRHGEVLRARVGLPGLAPAEERLGHLPGVGDAARLGVDLRELPRGPPVIGLAPAGLHHRLEGARLTLGLDEVARVEGEGEAVRQLGLPAIGVGHRGPLHLEGFAHRGLGLAAGGERGGEDLLRLLLGGRRRDELPRQRLLLLAGALLLLDALQLRRAGQVGGGDGGAALEGVARVGEAAEVGEVLRLGAERLGVLRVDRDGALQVARGSPSRPSAFCAKAPRSYLHQELSVAREALPTAAARRRVASAQFEGWRSSTGSIASSSIWSRSESAALSSCALRKWARASSVSAASVASTANWRCAAARVGSSSVARSNARRVPPKRSSARPRA